MTWAAKRRATTWLACIALVATSAVGCGHDAVSMWRADFETVCGTTPCGWTQVAGPPNAAVWIETLPGVHGIELVGDGVAVSGPIDPSARIERASLTSLRAHVVGRCDPGATLSLIVAVQTAAGGLPIATSATFDRPPLPSSWDGTRTTVPLVPTMSADPAARLTGLASIVVRKNGPGVCELDYLSLSDESQPFVE